MILKWPGGKKWLHKEVVDLIPKKINNYLEPFIGGGSFFFDLSKQQNLLPPTISKGFLSDVNPKLIAFFKALKSEPNKLHKDAMELILNHSEEQYYEVRNDFNKKTD